MPSRLGLASSEFAPELPAILEALDRGTIRPIVYYKQDPEAYDRVLAYIVDDLLELWDFFGQPQTLTPHHIEKLAKRIRQSYPHLTIEDVHLFSERASNCYYGRSYGALTPATIMEWIGTYWQERQTELEERAYQAHLSQKESRDYTPNEATAYLDRLVAKVTRWNKKN